LLVPIVFQMDKALAEMMKYHESAWPMRRIEMIGASGGASFRCVSTGSGYD
jgi:hypothetical protein